MGAGTHDEEEDTPQDTQRADDQELVFPSRHAASNLRQVSAPRATLNRSGTTNMADAVAEQAADGYADAVGAGRDVSTRTGASEE